MLLHSVSYFFWWQWPTNLADFSSQTKS